MSVSIKLSDEVVWGASGAGSGASSYGKVITCNKKSTVKQHEEQDEDGEPFSLVLYDQREELTLEILAGKTAVQPALGATITIGGVTDVIITEAETIWKRGDTKKFQVSGWKSVA